MTQKRYRFRAGDKLEFIATEERFTCAVDEVGGEVVDDDAGSRYQANACRPIAKATDEERLRMLHVWAAWQHDLRGVAARLQLQEVEPVPGGLDPKGKAGSLKCPMHLLPPSALKAAAWAHKHGAEKYGPYNWRVAKVCATTYVAAIMRHTDAYRDGEDLDPDSGLPHAAHIVASCNILIDAQHCGTLVDDRFKASPPERTVEERCGVTWDACYPERKKWIDLTPDAREEWVRVFTAFETTR